MSCNNDDGTAANTWQLRTDAGVNRRLVVHWNAIPAYLGTDTKIRAWDSTDVAAAGLLLIELLGLFSEAAVRDPRRRRRPTQLG